MVARPRLRAGCGPRPSLERPREGRKIQRVSDLPGPKTGGFQQFQGMSYRKKPPKIWDFLVVGFYGDICLVVQNFNQNPLFFFFWWMFCLIQPNTKNGLVVPLIRTVGAIKKGDRICSDILGVCFQITSSPVTSALRSCFSFRGCHGPYTSP